AIEADRIDVPVSIAAMIGTPVQQMKSPDESGAERWSLEPFVPNNSTLSGRIEVKAARAVLNDRYTVRSVLALLQFGAQRTSIELKDGDLGTGRMTGQFSLFSSAEGLSALSYVELIGADAALLFGSGGRKPVSGVFSMKATIEGAGLSPAAFLGSLHGNGSI